MRWIPLLLLCAACAVGPADIPDGERAPEGMATLVGSFQFSGFGIEPHAVFYAAKGNNTVHLVKRNGLFAVAIPPGDYEFDYVYVYRTTKDPIRFTARAGEVVYIGTWHAVLGPDIDIRNEWEQERPEFERRYGPMDVRAAYPQGYLLEIERDPSLDLLDDLGD